MHPPQPADSAALISCLMVTRDRFAQACLSVDCFLRQTYPHRELVIIDDSRDDRLARHVAALGDPRIVVERAADPAPTLGEARNRSVDRASGRYVCQWDDDDLYDPRRLEVQMRALAEAGAQACMLHRWTMWWPDTGRLATSLRRTWEGSLLCEKAAMPRYPALRRSEDTALVDALMRSANVVLLDEPRLYVYVAHGRNTFEAGHFEAHWQHADERFEGERFRALWAELAERMPLDAYARGRAAAAPPAADPAARPVLGTVVIPCYDMAGSIAGTLDSVAAAVDFHRTRTDARQGEVRVVVVDDASADDGAERAMAWARGRPDLDVVVVRRARNGGAAAARNLGVACAAGDLLWFLDADDALLPPHLTVGVLTMDAVPDAGAVRTRLDYSHPVHPDWRKPIEESVPIALCVRRTCHDFVGGFPEDECYRDGGGEDVGYAMLLNAAFLVAEADVETARYVRRPGNNFDRQYGKFSHPFAERARFPADGTPAQEQAREAARTRAMDVLLGRMHRPFDGPPRNIPGQTRRVPVSFPTHAFADPAERIARAAGEFIDRHRRDPQACPLDARSEPLVRAVGQEAADAGPDAALDRLLAIVRRHDAWFFKLAAAVAAQQLGRRTEALDLVERARGQNPMDLYAQELWLGLQEGANGRSRLEEIDAGLKGRFCERPFKWMEFVGKDAWVCCPSWLPVPIGAAEAAGAAWTGATARAIRASVLDGSFRHCSRLNCPWIADGALPRREDVAADAWHTPAPPPPTYLNLGYDDSCNLSCPSCRTEMRVANAETQERVQDHYRRCVEPMVATAAVVNVTGSGDPFASRHFRALIRELGERPDLRIDLQTNGVLFDERAWEDLSLSGRARRVWVSLDAADPATYGRVRRGGDFARALRNVAFLAGRRAAGELAFLGLDFVVQQANFREIPDFVALGESLGVDRVRFNMIRNWGTFGAAEFARHFIGSPRHPEHADFAAILDGPAFAAPIVDPGNLWQFVRRTRPPAHAPDPDVLRT